MSFVADWFVGIDIGTNSIRVAILNDRNVLVGTSEHEIAVLHHPTDSSVVTQDTAQVWSQLERCITDSLEQARTVEHGNVKSFCCGATCSLVVESKDGSNVILWMDHRGEPDTINSKMKQNHPKMLQRLGGSIIAEMALPKIKEYLKSDSTPLKIYDLHDWIECMLSGDTLEVPNYNTDNIGIDGSLKGFPLETLSEFDINLKEHQIGRAESVPYPGIPFAGTPIAKLAPSLAERWNAPNAVVCSGVIDCYSSFFALQNKQIDPEKNLVMVAGTSTCYLGVSKTPKDAPPGIWGPFHLTQDHWFYEGGLSCSGILFESLFENHPAAKNLDKSKNLFQQIEDLVDSFVQREELSSAWQLVSKRVYIGDYLGNRTPFNDSSLSSLIIGSSLRPDDRDLACSYLSIIEYLALSTKMIVDCFCKSGFELKSLQVCGSQAKNSRLMSLLALILETIDVYVPIGLDSKLIGAQGSSMLGGSSPKDVELQLVSPDSDENLKELLLEKQKIMFELLEKQQEINRRLSPYTSRSHE
ncbi:hypothetical protein OGAPHI_007258 [Ogataea philodendri]|uniref:Uncharacterized protein n=1 Tax=Ogataea philodendri TaxID=1378263 RepID=A0A9P8NTG7_9ASCO|nr:uncharacterized protein OGAPHI_007258 [Ogataea philodendri]KAH3660053.1 hypothetical protein OGAPHI_007258 [Ogataea philodendri]